ncbi:terminase small subunit [Aquamicrobium defluvii]|uniref:Terminase small subunit n=1 Tax=Aquamicrobium defluvii TaxID=69279 RepID=A0A4R6YER3_9HYPH|nr:terminase small subunit [Aquamicrobium defluvii]TDR34678.1 terminase small subunit [Aquamicrobium defluvii]
MSVLPNPRHEAFAQSLAKGKTAIEAYADAGYKPNRSHASRLVAKGNVTARVAELQQKVAKKVEVTVESLAGELEEARALALTERQTSAAVQATMGKAKLFGLGVENRRLSGSVQVVTITAKDLDGLTEDELAILERAYPILQRIGVFGGTGGAEAEEGG